MMGGGTGGRGLNRQKESIEIVGEEIVTLVNVEVQLIVHSIPQKN